MSISDPIADMLTRIRNAQTVSMAFVEIPFSTMALQLLVVFKSEGYIRDFEVFEKRTNIKSIKVSLKYHAGAAVIKNLVRISKPGRRIYSGINDLKKYYNGLGVVILSTPKGVMSDHQARLENVGGEVLCKVF